MAGLYDGYQLSNSSQIKQFQGSAVPELMQVGQQLQQQYETGRQYDDMIARMLPNTSALPEDQKLLMDLRDKYTNRLKDRAAKGDYEHMYRDTIMDSKDVVQEYKPIAENQQRFLAYQKDLQDKLDKGYIKTPETINKLIAASRINYKGLQKDPVTGQYVNKFQGMDPAKEINITEWVDKALDHFAPQTIGSSVRKIDGEYYKTVGSKTVKLEQKDIDKVLNAAKSLDPEWQAYTKQKAILDTVGYDKMDGEIAEKAFGSGTAIKIMEAAQQSGKSVGQVAQQYAQQSILQDLNHQASTYASKFVRNDRDSEFAINGMTEDANRAHQAAYDAEQRFLAPAPDTKLEEKDRDVDNIQKTVAGLSASLGDLDAQIARANPSEKAVLEQQKMAIQDQITSKNAIVQGAQDVVARRLGYNNYGEVSGKALDKVAQPIRVINPDGTGGTLTKEQAKDAIQKDAARFIETGGNEVGYWQVTTPNGVVKVDKKDWDKVSQMHYSKASATDEIDKQVAAEVKGNAESYAMKPMNMSLSESEAKGLKQTILGNPSGHAFFKTGTTKRLADDEVPKDFDLDNIQLVQKGGSYYLTGHGMATVKGEGKQPTGQTYNIQVTPGSNYGKVIASNLLKKKEKLTPDMSKAAAQLAGFTYTGDIMNLQMSEPLMIRQDGKPFATVVRAPYESAALSGKSRYLLTGTDGKVLMETEDATEIDDRVRAAVEKSIQNSKP